MTGAELFEKVKAARPDAKEGSVGQCLNKWKKAKGLIKTRGGKKTVKKAKPGRAAAVHSNATGLMGTLKRVAELAAIIDIPEDKLADVVRVLSR